MDTEDLQKLVQNIVKDAARFKDKHAGEEDASVNYACLFAQSQGEFEAWAVDRIRFYG